MRSKSLWCSKTNLLSNFRFPEGNSQSTSLQGPCVRAAFSVSLVTDNITAAMARPASCKQVDDTFGPYAGNCRGGFDFTLLFEDSILSILPLALLLLVAPFRISYLFRRAIKVDPSSWLASKLVSGPTQHFHTLSTTWSWA